MEKDTKKKKKGVYVIQKHHASHLHYDLRLERDGVLKSWAVPKEPSNNPKIKRLAVMVDDHAVGYASFEGEIPKGQYGAGKVEIWDAGSHEPIDWQEDKIVTKISGKKFDGIFVLVKLKKDNSDKNWLFFRKKDKVD